VTLDELIHSSDPDALLAAASDPSLTEDLALSLLKRTDLSADVLEALPKNSAVLKGRKVKIALIRHPHTPRHISVPMIRGLYTFDLMNIALTPITPADVKRVADEALIVRVPTISRGERLTLARRASGAVAAALLNDKDPRVIGTALDNSRLTDAAIIKALSTRDASEALVQAVCAHPKWSMRHEVQIALLRNEKTPLARALQFAQRLTAAQLREILQQSPLPAEDKAYLLRESSEGKPRHTRMP
jgi:hypothetical protein